MRRLPSVVLLGVALGLVAGCGGEEEVRDDGLQGVPAAGLEPQLDAGGVEVLEDGSSVADVEEVVAALEKSQVRGPDATRPADVADGFVAFDPTATAGLLSVVGDDAGTTVVLVFTDPAAAAVFAAGEPEVFADATTDGERTAYLAGNVVGYATTADDQPARVRRALDALDEVDSPSSTDSTDSTDSTTSP